MATQYKQAVALVDEVEGLLKDNVQGMTLEKRFEHANAMKSKMEEAGTDVDKLSKRASIKDPEKRVYGKKMIAKVSAVVPRTISQEG